jgi:hypothetical protein
MLSPMPWAWPASSTLVQDQGIFHAQDEGCDGTGSNLIGFYGLKGKLRTNLLRLMPFPFALPTFVPSDAAHCAIRLLVKIAIADLCKKTFPPKPGAANLWISNATDKFKNGD